MNGASSETIPKGASYSDPGATATDNEDGTISVSSNYSSLNPDVNTPDVYTITYTATDKAGNVTTASRSITVSWTGSQLAGNYDVVDTCIINSVVYPDQYVSTAIQSAGNTYRVSFSNLSNVFTGNTYADIVTKNMTIPTQKPNGSTSQYKVSGTGVITQSGSTIYWNVNYSVTDTISGSVSNCHAIFTSQ